ncbi:WhiB family transcriptional regulator [Oerskovia enterophila]|uniref:Transcriptional regulator WhiB n=1 Tax=Oerskovia enterophila TaxID=43678 RepID=A0A163S6C6_9CELL|nr:WhiB family transcriptional regulator [Oerskovia enterophila]KZM36060.1 transcriptional regulator WhiB1 [Oerskovia enterophila]OCI32328.1 transcriptional regulator WhiB [Oerskovia enterophila]
MTNLRAQTLTRPTNALATREPEDWRLDAECRDWDHTLKGDPWHPDSDLPGAYDDARTICAGCPVAEACLQTAIEAESSSHGGLRFGMYGGTTPAERTAVLREQQRERAARGAAA